MGGAIPQEFIDAVRDKVDIVDLIAEYVKLDKRGQQFVGLCPFHEESSPSFTVSPDKQMFYCFGCGAGGTVFSFLMQKDNLSFPEAVTALATRAGMEIRVAGQSTTDRQQARLLEINRLASGFFADRLKDSGPGKLACRYLQERHVPPETVEKFQIGYAPGGNELINFLRSRGYEIEEIRAAGLVVQRQEGGYRELFRERLMFPISDRRGQILGFGGRVIGPGEPKYINTPETRLFHKGRVVYGMHQSLPGIRRRGYVLVVEGYMDVISAHAHQVDWAVASLGTALTPEQARVMRTVAAEVVIAYDGDKAGQAATWRGLRILQQAGCRVRVARLPGGLDPDDYLNQQGPASFVDLIEEQALPLIDYKLQTMLQVRRGGIPEKLAVVNELAPDLASLPHAGERIEYIRMVAEKLGLSQQAVMVTVSQLQPQDKKVKNRHNKTGTFLEALPAYKKAQAQLLAGMAEDREICRQVLAELSWQDWEDPRAREIAQVLAEAMSEVQPGVQWNPAALLERVEKINQESAAWLAKIIGDRMAGRCHPENTTAAIKSLKAFQLHKQIEEKVAEIRAHEAGGEIANIGGLLQDVVALRRELEQLR